MIILNRYRKIIRQNSTTVSEKKNQQNRKELLILRKDISGKPASGLTIMVED